MKTNLTRRGTLLGVFLSAVATLTGRASEPAPTPSQQRWRLLDNDKDSFQAGDVGCAIDPSIVAARIQSSGCVISEDCQLHLMGDWMIGMPISRISSPRKFSWWRPVPVDPATPRRLYWQRLEREALQAGDFWSSVNPNFPEEQRGGFGYNLQLQAVQTGDYGRPANEVFLNSGAHWRPIALG